MYHRDVCRMKRCVWRRCCFDPKVATTIATICFGFDHQSIHIVCRPQLSDQLLWTHRPYSRNALIAGTPLDMSFATDIWSLRNSGISIAGSVGCLEEATTIEQSRAATRCHRIDVQLRCLDCDPCTTHHLHLRVCGCTPDSKTGGLLPLPLLQQLEQRHMRKDMTRYATSVRHK